MKKNEGKEPGPVSTVANDDIEKTRARAEKNRELIMEMVKNGELPEPRPMTRAERLKIDRDGLNILKIKRDDQRPFWEIQDDMREWILKNIYPEFTFDALPNNVVEWFAEYSFMISFRDDLSTKN